MSDNNDNDLFDTEDSVLADKQNMFLDINKYGQIKFLKKITVSRMSNKFLINKYIFYKFIKKYQLKQ